MCLSRCQQCWSQGDDITGTCTECKRIFCENCYREHKNKFPKHKYVYRDDIKHRDDIKRGIHGFEYHTTIVPTIGEMGQYSIYNTRFIDMKSVEGMVVILMVKNLQNHILVYNPVTGDNIKLPYHLPMTLDRHKSQITIIDENTVAITAPCTRHIHIVNFRSDILRKINCSTEMTGAIAFIDKTLYVACTGQIRKINLQGKEILSIDVPGIQFLHPVGQTKLYCVRSYPDKHISYLDITNDEEYQLSEFPYHLGRFTSDDCGTIYFISSNSVRKAQHDGTDCSVILTDKMEPTNAKRICFDISNNLLLVQGEDRYVSILKKV